MTAFVLAEVPRNAEFIIKQWQLEDCIPPSAPSEGISLKTLKTEDDVKELSREDASMYKAIVARRNDSFINR